MIFLDFFKNKSYTTCNNCSTGWFSKLKSKVVKIEYIHTKNRKIWKIIFNLDIVLQVHVFCYIFDIWEYFYINSYFWYLATHAGREREVRVYAHRNEKGSNSSSEPQTSTRVSCHVRRAIIDIPTRSNDDEVISSVKSRLHKYPIGTGVRRKFDEGCFDGEIMKIFIDDNYGKLSTQMGTWRIWIRIN